MHSHDAGTREDERESCETALQWCKLCHPRLKTKNQKQNNHTTVCDAVLKNSPNMPFYTQALLHTGHFTHRPLYTQTILHTPFYTDTCTHRRFYTQTLLHRRFYTQTLLYTDPFTHRRFYTQTLWHTDPFTHRRFYTQMLLHTGAFTHRPFYTQALLHTDPFTHRPFFTQTLLHTNAFTHTDAFTHEPFYTQLLLHTEAFTHRRFYTQTLLHTDPFIHKRFYTQTLLHTDACTHNWNRNFTSVFDTRTSFCAWRVHPAHLKSQFYLSFWHSNLVSCERVDVSTRHAWNRNFTSVFDTRTSFCAWRVHPARLKSQFYLSFWHSNLVSCVKGSSATLAIAILPQFWTLEPRFVRKGCNRQLKVAILPQFLTLEPRFVREGFIRTSWNRNFTSVFDTRTSFRAKGLTFPLGTLEIAILPQFLTLEPRFVREGFIRHAWNRNFTSVFDTRTSFRAWRVHPDKLKSQFYLSFWHSNLVSCERVDVSWSVVGTARGLKRERRRRREWKGRERQRGEREREREREEREREREKERENVRMWGCEDVKMWRCEDVKMWMWRCEDVQMWGYEDVKMWRCEDVRMWRCEDVMMWGREDVKMWGCEVVKMWRCDDVKMWKYADPTFRRTLRSDALGKNRDTLVSWISSPETGPCKMMRLLQAVDPRCFLLIVEREWLWGLQCFRARQELHNEAMVVAYQG